jgi:hypothetical protein
MKDNPSTSDVLAKYSQKLSSQLKESNTPKESLTAEMFSEEYMRFKQDMIPSLGRYEKWAK